jgi:hypothetical protein
MPHRKGPARDRPSPKNTTYATKSIASQQVSWWEVREFVAPILARVGSWPMAGTPAWRALDGSDPAKIAAVLDAGQHHSLRVETCQQAICEASRNISAAVDWSSVARELKGLREFYAEKPYLKRIAS